MVIIFLENIFMNDGRDGNMGCFFYGSGIRNKENINFCKVEVNG